VGTVGGKSMPQSHAGYLRTSWPLALL